MRHVADSRWTGARRGKVLARREATEKATVGIQVTSLAALAFIVAGKVDRGSRKTGVLK